MGKQKGQKKRKQAKGRKRTKIAKPAALKTEDQKDQKIAVGEKVEKVLKQQIAAETGSKQDKFEKKAEKIRVIKGIGVSGWKRAQAIAGKFNFKKILIALGLLLLLLLLIVPAGIYFYSPLGKVTRPVFEKIAYPLAFVGEEREIISTKELLENTNSVKKFYEDQDLASKGLRVDFNTPDGKLRLKIKEKDVLDKLVENRIVEQLGKKHGIYLTQEDAQREIETKIKEFGNKKALELSLASLYGWGVDDFRDQVVIYQMYTKKLLERYAEISKAQKEYQELEEAYEKLKKDGTNFAEIVKEYSEGESKKNGGELGWFPLDKINAEVAQEIENYQKGQISGIISSRLGFHIVQLQDYREVEEVLMEDDKGRNLEKGEIVKRKEIKLRQVFKRGVSFLKWIEQEKQKAKVKVWAREYEWDQKSGHIRFADEQMRLWEKRIKARSKGDPSIKTEK